MKRYLISIITIIVCTLSVGAQNRTTLVQRINEIKSQTGMYYWNQYTHPNADTAKYNAIKFLLLDVNSGRSADQMLSVEAFMPYAKFINIDRGNLKQYFAYIKIDEAAAITGGGGSPSVANRPVVNMPVETASATVSPQTQKSFVPDAFVQRIMDTGDFVNVYKLLKALQSQGEVLQFGKLRDIEDYSSLDLILFDIQSQKVLTMLSPVTASGNRINVVSGHEDSLDNYPTNLTAVIWYIKK